MAFSPNAQTVYADGPAGSPFQPAKSEIRKLLKQYENVIEAFLTNGGLIFASKASLDASLNYAANTMAWVLGDATVANNGIYRKIGASGAGSWTRVSDLPFSFIIASDVGAGTANAIKATTSIPVSSSALVWTNIFETNTASPVTISFNGGSALTIKAFDGADIIAAGLTSGMVIGGFTSGSTFRMISDQSRQALIAAMNAAVAAAEAAQDGAESANAAAQAAKTDAETARDLAEAYASDAATVSGVNVPIYASVASASGATIVAGVKGIQVQFYSPTYGNAETLVGGAVYSRATSEPNHDLKFRSTDRFLPNGTTDATNGGWWEVSQEVVMPEMAGAKGGAVRGSADGAITSGANSFTSATATFTGNDVGKSIVIKGAGASGANLVTTIANVSGGTTVALSEPAATTVANADWCYGHDDAAAIKSVIGFIKARGGGEINIGSRTYLILSNLKLPSNVKVIGKGRGASVILHPNSHCWKNDDTINGNRNITIADMTLDACRMFDGGVAMDGVRRMYASRLEINNPKNRGITVGIGIAAIAGFASNDINIADCTFNVPDYGVVVGSTDGYGAIKGVKVTGCTFFIGWGSAVSLAGDVKEATVSNNTIVLIGNGPGTGTGGAGDPINNPNIGIGVKIWAGTSASVCPETITVTGNTVVGISTKVEMIGVTVSDFSNNITVSGNSFDQLTNAVRNDFNSNARGLAVNGNTVKRSNYGIYNITSSDFRTVVKGNTFEDCVFGLHGTFRSSPISGNRFANISEDAMVLLSPSRNAAITGNTGDGIGKSFIRQTGTSANTSLLLISGNNVQNCGTLANNTYDVLDLSDQSHNVTSNSFVNEAANKPRYIIGGAGTHRLVNSNWLFGAGTGYYETAAGGTDVFANNLQRGL